MNIVYFTHSLVSCWNHGNAHFLRGLLRELVARGHNVSACERRNAWSRVNLAAETGADPGARFLTRFPDLDIVTTYGANTDVSSMVDGADLVVVHEWTDPALIEEIGKAKAGRSAHFTLLFHDTHHRAVSNPDQIRALDLSAYDGVLAFGPSLADVYCRAGWGNRVFVFHEAADTRLFKPPSEENERERKGAVWIGNWGDGEREEELKAFLLRPAGNADVPLDIYGVRYPQDLATSLTSYGATYRGWLPNDHVPDVFARHAFTVHVPRSFYSRQLPGIPTIRVFEALACGIPLLSSPWDDEGMLFSPGADFLMAADEAEMTRYMRVLSHDNDLCKALARAGVNSIRARHTCAHRAEQLLKIASVFAPRLKGAA